MRAREPIHSVSQDCEGQTLGLLRLQLWATPGLLHPILCWTPLAQVQDCAAVGAQGQFIHSTCAIQTYPKHCFPSGACQGCTSSTMDKDTVTEINVCLISSGLLWIAVCKAKQTSNIEIMALQNIAPQLFNCTTREHVAGLCTTTLLSGHCQHELRLWLWYVNTSTD